jgi:hypothetical protein
VTGQQVLVVFGTTFLESAPVLDGQAVVIVADNDLPDSTARKAADKAARLFAERGYETSVARPPGGIKDSNELLVKRGVAAVCEMVAAAVPYEVSREKAAGNGEDAKADAAPKHGHPAGPNKRLTELGNSHRLICRHAADIRYIHPLKAWFIWNGISWRRDESGEIMRRAEATIEAIFDEAKEIADEEIRTALRKFALKSQSNAQVRESGSTGEVRFVNRLFRPAA